ncbi:hypothetical protein EAG08_19895 [Chryseobacterium sp. 3008163]|nr:hypothetical protein EAG08_19895 [Chryseobacterium sp. 3008163]
MKGLVKIIGMVGVVSMMLVSCVVHDHHGRRPIPPGHAKKIYGGGSAKHYAPGQMKKRGHHRGRH